jgi:hypothetical protein
MDVLRTYVLVGADLNMYAVSNVTSSIPRIYYAPQQSSCMQHLRIFSDLLRCGSCLEPGKNRLNQIALAGKGGRVERFALGKLAAHRGKTVDVLIKESVNSHLERSNYNDTRDIVAVLELAGIVVA